MRRYPLAIIALSLSLPCCLLQESSAADPTAAKAAVQTLLEKAWDKTAAAKAVADHAALDAPPLKDDAFVLAARWLVLLHQSRYDDGLATLERFLQAQPTHLLALRARVWAYATKHDYRQAMIAADHLSQAVSLAAVNPSPSALPTADDELQFLGRLSGFLQGPVEKQTDQAVREKFEARVLERCDERAKKIFADAKADVLDYFQQLTTAAAAAKQDKEQSAQTTKDQKLNELSEQNSKLLEESQKLEGQGKKLADDLKNRLAELDRQDAPLLQRQIFLQGQVTSFSAQLNQQQALLDRAQQQASSNKTSNFSLTTEINQAQTAIATLRGQLDGASTQLALTQAARLNIQQQRIAAGGGAMMQGQQLETMRQDVEYDKLKNENKQKRTEKTKHTASTKALALENEAHAYSTYESFPFEALRETLRANAR